MHLFFARLGYLCSTIGTFNRGASFFWLRTVYPSACGQASTAAFGHSAVAETLFSLSLHKDFKIRCPVSINHYNIPAFLTMLLVDAFSNGYAANSSIAALMMRSRLSESMLFKMSSIGSQLSSAVEFIQLTTFGSFHITIIDHCGQSPDARGSLLNSVKSDHRNSRSCDQMILSIHGKR